MLFNPAYTGIKGTSGISFKYKTQWYSSQTAAYKTSSLVYEESLPCNILDYGFKLLYDQEGDGLFTTLEAGALLVATPSFRQHHSNHNFRIGADISWGMHDVAYDRLIFSDQLDPQTGPGLPGKFIPPNDGRSEIYFNPGLGILYKGLFDTRSENSQILNLGIAVYNVYTFQSGLFSNSRSVLGLSPIQSVRWTAFAEYELIPYARDNQYISIKPLVYYQHQNQIQSADAGLRFGLSGILGLGLYFHFTDFEFSKHTGWINLSADFGWKINENQKLLFTLSYCNNYSGLQNFAGMIFELGVAYHFKKLTKSCGSANKVNCNSFTSPKNKIYENIW
jgi:type IX secretion system PorP/SprF family membrane protein